MGFVSYISFMETYPPLALLDHLKYKSLFVPLGRGDSSVSLLEIISDTLKTNKLPMVLRRGVMKSRD